MKLATLRNGSRDGQLVVVSRDLSQAIDVPQIAATLQAALDDWTRIAPQLLAVAETLERGAMSGAFAFDPERAMAPLPRAYHWVDGSAYVNHVELVRKARGVSMPESFWTDPLVYQGGSDDFLGARQDVPVPSEEFGIDLEGEVAVITDDVPMGTKRQQATSHIRLLMLVSAC
jgi:fumarylacetoacetate (FAA) hydrolase